jgi:hypothetical protein
LELSAIAHALQARRLLQDLWIDDDALSDQATLFLVATAALVQSLSVLSQGPSLPMHTGDDYLIGGQAPARTIADRAGALLDMREARYGELWAGQADSAAPSAPAMATSLAWSS